LDGDLSFPTGTRIQLFDNLTSGGLANLSVQALKVTANFLVTGLATLGSLTAPLSEAFFTSIYAASVVSYNGLLSLSGSFIPTVDGLYQLGNSNFKFSNVYATDAHLSRVRSIGNTLHLDSLNILPSNSLTSLGSVANPFINFCASTSRANVLSSNNASVINLTDHLVPVGNITLGNPTNLYRCVHVNVVSFSGTFNVASSPSYNTWSASTIVMLDAGKARGVFVVTVVVRQSVGSTSSFVVPSVAIFGYDGVPPSAGSNVATTVLNNPLYATGTQVYGGNTTTNAGSYNSATFWITPTGVPTDDSYFYVSVGRTTAGATVRWRAQSLLGTY